MQVLGDLSMTLCDPFAINFLSQSAMKLINHQVRYLGNYFYQAWFLNL